MGLSECWEGESKRRFMGNAPSMDSLEQLSPVPCVVIDETGRVRDMNSAAEEFMGDPLREAAGKQLGQLLNCVRTSKGMPKPETDNGCRGCIVGDTLNHALETGKAHRRREVSIPVSENGEERKLYLRLSTIPLNGCEEPRVAVWLEDLTSLKESEKRYVELAGKDPLTNLANRRRLQEELHRSVAETQRYGGPLSLSMLDIDEFKAVNDTEGHQAGDDLLRAFAGFLRDATREADLAARYGGDEFVILMPRTGLTGARRMVERLRHDFMDGARSVVNSQVSVSAGVTELGTRETPDELLKRADQALYRAKHRGGNQVAVGLKKNLIASSEKSLVSNRLEK